MLFLALGALGCARPPEYPPDERHLRAIGDPQICYDCHHTPTEPTTPPMHPSHFLDDGSLKEERNTCTNCHHPSLEDQ